MSAMPMDLEFLLDKPVERIQQFWGDDPDRADDLELILTVRRGSH
jgi:hypothetical protein